MEATEMARRTIGVLCLVLVGLVPGVAMAQTEQVYYYHTDAVGSVRMITDSNGQEVVRYDYLPFGQVWGSPALDHRMFTGEEHDGESGLDYLGARSYAGMFGRFTTPDDSSYMDPANPQSLNRYAYAYNNPLRWVDPTGHAGECPPPTDTSTCVEGHAPDIGLMQFLVNSLFRPVGEAVQQVAQPVIDVFNNPPDPGCVAGYASAGALGGAALAALPGLATGPAEPGVVLAGAATGGLRGTVVGVGACMAAANGGGGGGGGGNTTHGSGRLGERNFTPEEVAETKTGRIMTQADGAKVYVKEIRPGRFNVIVEGERGIITGMKNLDQRAIANLARNYGWR
jgi:RHS repeat-associated protein